MIASPNFCLNIDWFSLFLSLWCKPWFMTYLRQTKNTVVSKHINRVSVHKIYFAMEVFSNSQPLLSCCNRGSISFSVEWKVCKIHLHTENFQVVFALLLFSSQFLCSLGQWSSLLCHPDALDDLEHSWGNEEKRRKLIMENNLTTAFSLKLFTWSTDNKHKQTQEPRANRGGIFIGFLNKRNANKLSKSGCRKIRKCWHQALIVEKAICKSDKTKWIQQVVRSLHLFGNAIKWK